MSYLSFRRQVLLGLVFSLFFVVSLGAQSGLGAVAGSWQGDKALGTVLIRDDGTGEITFEANSELRMAIKVTEQGGQYTVAQAEPNKPAFYVAFNAGPNAAKRIAKEARPMKWIFRLSADRSTLAGKKETSGIKYSDQAHDDVTAIDNSYVRDSQWARLTGKVAAPEVSKASGSYAPGQSLVLSCSTPGASIRYALNGATVSETSGTVYTAPIPVNANTTLVAVAVKDGWQVSDVLKAEYRIETASAPAPALSMKASWRNFTVELVRCHREGTEVILDFKATNNDELSRNFGLCRWETRLFDAEGDAFTRTEAFFAGESAGMGTVASGSLPSGIPVKCAIKFFDIPPSVKSIKILELQVMNDQPTGILNFRDVAIAE